LFTQIQGNCFYKHHVHDLNLDVKTDQEYIRIHVKSKSESTV
jgi:hypothetical protein